MTMKRLKFCILAAALAAGAAHAQGAAASGRADEELHALESQVGANPFDPVALNNLAAVKAGREDWYGASDLLVRAHKLAPGNPVIDGNLKQINDWLALRAKPAQPGPVNPALSEIPAEPPPLWQPASVGGGQNK
jgi:Flp pilus assembly protein TadD